MEMSQSEMEERFKKADERMFQLEKDIAFFESFMTRYASAVENKKEIDAFYYQDSYLKELAELEKNDSANYWSASEDGIWNLGIDFHSVRMKMLKMLTDDLYQDTLIIEK